MSHENEVKYKFLCLQIKFYSATLVDTWSMAALGLPGQQSSKYLFSGCL